ncbi:MAG TPA: DNA polymerase III subunit gamma and tau [Streptosporangiaceae bacterium]|nr:DNA polymerase III subunit gamma and tau [Streptosporangiaceae bacterium]
MAGDVSGSGSSAADRDPASGSLRPAPLALYRRYRPATFAEVKGQEHVTEPLRQALRSGRVNHAYLFSGPRGCGKTSSARILARSLNCEEGPTPDPCGRCASCVALAPMGPGSIDVIEIDAASHGGIDDARELRERAFYSPVAARYKVYIIDEAHMVTGAGFNALLKLVEEPPPHLKFVFATTEPEKVIATIRSRTHHYPFRLVPPGVLRELLEHILAAEEIIYEPAVLPVVIRAGAGSVRDSLSVLDQLIAGADEGGLRYDRAIALLGYTDDALLDEMALAFGAHDGAAVFRAIDHVVEAGHDPRRFAMDLLDRLRDLIVLDAVPDAGKSGLLDVPEDWLDRMREQAASLGGERLVRAAETINAGLVEMRGATSPRLLLELMCAQVLLPPTAPVAPPAGEVPAVGDAVDLVARIERLERRLSAGAAAGPPAPSAPPVRSASPAAARPERNEQPRPQPERQPARQPERQPEPQREPPQARPARRDQSEPDRDRRAEREPSAHAGPGHSAAPSGAGGDLDLATLRARWPDVLDAVREVRKVAWILLSNAAAESVEGNVVTLAFGREGDAKGFGGSGCDQDLAGVLTTMFGVRPVIRTIVMPGGPSPVAGVGRERRQPPPSAGPGPSPDQGPDQSRRPDRRPGPVANGGAPADQETADQETADQEAADQETADQETAGPPGAGNGGHGAHSARPPAVGAPGTGQSGGPGKRTGAGRQPDPGPADDPRPLTDPDASDEGDMLSGSDLVMRELGGRVVEETSEV